MLVVFLVLQSKGLQNRDFKIGHYGRLGRLDRCHVTQNTRDLLPSSFWDGTVCFGPVSRRADNGILRESSFNMTRGGG